MASSTQGSRESLNARNGTESQQTSMTLVQYNTADQERPQSTGSRTAKVRPASVASHGGRNKSGPAMHDDMYNGGLNVVHLYYKRHR